MNLGRYLSTWSLSWVLVHMMQWYTISCSPLITLTLLSVYCLFYYVVWLNFIPIKFTIVYQFLPLDSENDLCFKLYFLDSYMLMYYILLSQAVLLWFSSEWGHIVKQTVYPAFRSVFIVKMSSRPLLLYDPLLFLLFYLSHIMLIKTLSYHFHTLCFFI